MTTNQSVPTSARQILSFWLSDTPDDPASAKANHELWFKSTKAGDELIRSSFGNLLSQAESGHLNSWLETDLGKLAVIILLDQFSRNIYRGSAAAFQNDEQALTIASSLVDAGRHEQLGPIQQVFLFLPFEHSENLANQNRCLTLFEKLLSSVDTDWQPLIAGFYEHARQHQEIIERYGRFPHRNKILGRPDNADEKSYFAEGGKSFGQ